MVGKLYSNIAVIANQAFQCQAKWYWDELLGPVIFAYVCLFNTSIFKSTSPLFLYMSGVELNQQCTLHSSWDVLQVWYMQADLKNDAEL